MKEFRQRFWSQLCTQLINISDVYGTYEALIASETSIFRRIYILLVVGKYLDRLDLPYYKHFLDVKKHNFLRLLVLLAFDYLFPILFPQSNMYEFSNPCRDQLLTCPTTSKTYLWIAYNAIVFDEVVLSPLFIYHRRPRDTRTPLIIDSLVCPPPPPSFYKEQQTAVAPACWKRNSLHYWKPSTVFPYFTKQIWKKLDRRWGELLMLCHL
jgi:hypothetical protein